MTSPALRVVIVDDSLVFRKILSDLLAEISGITVVGQAPNGKIGLQKILQFKPDLVLLDMDLPEMNGLEVLEAMRANGVESGVIVVSGSSPKMGSQTMKALSQGAFELVSKPTGETIEETRGLLAGDLKMAVQAFLHRTSLRRSQATPLGSPLKPPPAVLPLRPPPSPPKTGGEGIPARDHRPAGFRADLLVIGISTGGPPALMEIFSRLSQPLTVPVLIVQHIPPLFSEALAASIREKTHLAVEEGTHGRKIQPGCIFLAPGGAHMLLARGEEKGTFVLHISSEPPENNCRPSIDCLGRSVAQNFPGRTAFFIMTGMGTDGLEAARLIRAAGGYVCAQSEESCVVFGMPRAVIEAGLANEILSLNQIPLGLERLTQGLPARLSPSGRFPALIPPEKEKA